LFPLVHLEHSYLRLLDFILAYRNRLRWGHFLSSLHPEVGPFQTSIHTGGAAANAGADYTRSIAHTLTKGNSLCEATGFNGATDLHPYTSITHTAPGNHPRGVQTP
ncbi:MAG TPA: hypothetical protein VFA32_04015, partial [Dehalococcoidia bacterium]|nr:hypothetical protein [Dehalococcoidia bacterium]